MSDLELVSTDDLMNELCERADIFFCVWLRLDRSDGDDGWHTHEAHAYKADGTGLLEELIDEIMEEAEGD